MQRKTKTELETKDNLIQDMEKYFDPNPKLCYLVFVSEEKNQYAVAESNLMRQTDMMKKRFSLKLISIKGI